MEQPDYNFIKSISEIETWPIMQSIVPLASILGAYLLLVLKLGPWFMANRKPYKMQRVLIWYNFFLVIMSVYLASMPLARGHITTLFQSCHTKVPDEFMASVAECTWYFLMSKFIELADTVFFVLRKKQNQITFLHVFHHTSTAIWIWIYLKYLPGPQGIIIMVLNSTVHVFMYSYYMLAAMGPAYQKYLWWKKYITSLQLVQFISFIIYMIGLLLFNCQFPKLTSLYFIILGTLFLGLFTDFYRKTYTKKSTD